MIPTQPDTAREVRAEPDAGGAHLTGGSASQGAAGTFGSVSDTSNHESGPQSLTLMDPAEWVARHGDYLFRHALARTGRQEVAEDMVQETFVAAWRSAAQYSGAASERSWLLGILRNKVADHFRRHQREVLLEDVEALAAFENRQFTGPAPSGGAWQSRCVPSHWRDARDSLERAEFWDALHECVGKLPEKTARAFVLRELDGVGTSGICDELGIGLSHLFVMLHRARLALRRCLELNWFNERSNRPLRP